ncbi:MAG: hypothetical protein ACR2IX_10900 [Limnohabitans sp.]
MRYCSDACRKNKAATPT